MIWSNFCVCKTLETGDSKDNDGAALLSIELILTDSPQTTNINRDLSRKCSNSAFCIIYYITIGSI